jgi:serine/threonine-protein kinase
LSLGDVDGAEEQFRLVIVQEHERRFATFALAHGDLAKVYLQRGDAHAALEESRRAVESFKHVTGRRDVRSGPYLWLIHAEALRQSGQTREAHDLAQRALDASRKYDAPESEAIKLAESALQHTVS